MMAPFLVSVLLYIPLTIAATFMMVRREDRGFVLRVVAAAWLVLLPLTILSDLLLPFSGDGDDTEYFRLAHTVTSQSGLSIARFVGFMDQPGYPWLLSILNHVTGPSLLAYKLHNLCFLILVAITWYRIAVTIESSRLGRWVVIAVLAVTPLWYYVFILRKDMTIALLQSVFLLGLVEQWHQRSARSWWLMGGSTALLVLFRMPLIAQHAIVALSALFVRSFAIGTNRRRLAPLVVAFVVFFAVARAVSNPEFLTSVGMSSARAGLLDPAALAEAIEEYHELSSVRGPAFPVIYLLTETAAWSPQMWVTRGAPWLRAVLALPWIFFVLPLFALGMLWLVRAQPEAAEAGGVTRLRATRLIATPWAAVVLFIASSLAISWSVGETTRWRIPDMPAFATIAVAGWMHTTPRIRQETLVYWVTIIGTLFSAYYLLRQF
jgi:hypothetical protein